MGDKIKDNTQESMKKVLVSIKDLTVENDSGTVLQQVTTSISQGERIGLVGANGSGKSTLLKIIAGSTMPSSGEVRKSGTVYYVPQLDLPLFQSEVSILDYLSSIYNDWWEVIEIMERHFNFGEVNVEQTLKTLSGGELIKLHLSIALILNPDCLLLDEPTNHLDIPSLAILIEFLKQYKNAFVVVSHDPFFLDQVVEDVWEIEDKKLNRFGGNYTDYQEQKSSSIEARARQQEAARKELLKVRKAMQREQERAARSRRTGREMKHDRSMSAVEKGYFKERSSQAAGSKGAKLEEAKADAESQVASLSARKRRKARLGLESDGTSKGRKLVKLSKGVLGLNTGKVLVENAEIEISYGDRIVIVGRNGAGKTMLVKSLLGKAEGGKLEGETYLAPDSRIVYLSQKYEIVNPSLSLVDNMMVANPDLTYEQIRKQLGSFLFYNEEDIRKPASVLSGGEVARLAFAMVTSGAVDLLALDEPTNNLDIDTIDSIVEALQDFPGAIIVISHNIDFLSQVGMDSAFVINNYRLKKLSANPENEEQFYGDIVSELES